VVDLTTSCYSLTVGQGGSGVLEFESTNARTLTVSHDVLVSPGAVLRASNAGSQTAHVLSVGGNMTNDGTLDFSTNGGAAGAGLTFTSSANASFTGGGTVTDLRTLTVNKGTSIGPTLTLAPATLSVQGVAAGAAPFLTLTNGTLRLSGTFSLSSTVFASSSYVLGATAGLWLDNP